MKKFIKPLIVSAGATLIVGGAVLNFLLAHQPRTPQEQLTLENIEVLGAIIKDYENAENGMIGWCVGDYGKCDEPFPGHIIPGGFVSRN